LETFLSPEESKEWIQQEMAKKSEKEQEAWIMPKVWQRVRPAAQVFFCKML
jgi:type 1 glutamine amidotransferase